ncbi:MAG: DUF3298 domain-containing protein [Bacteroidales bacterium]|nr:DUF3298 domain-containing protein [Bacteroidales bacterium]
MKKISCILFTTALAASLLCSCEGIKKQLPTKTWAFSDTTAHSSLSCEVELPSASDKASSAIREELMAVLDGQLGYIVSFEGTRQFEPYSGDRQDTEAYLKYYFDNALKVLERDSADDALQRESYMREDDQMAEEEIAEILAGMPGWEYEFSLAKIADTKDYVVFQSQDYVYLGGAHGGVTGAGGITFDRKSGRRVTQVIDPGCAEDIQPMLREGLTDYFAEGGLEVAADSLGDYLLTEGDLIPLPAWQPYPTPDGLVFVYQQYEIAAYAFGMPAFTVPYDKIAAYLTPEAKKILGL